VPEPSVVEPSLKVTVPVAAVGVTVAVNVVLCPVRTGLTLEASVVVATLAALTVWVLAAEVLALRIASRSPL